VQGLSNWPSTTEGQTGHHGVRGAHEILCQASIEDVVVESGMSFIVSAVLGYHIGGSGGGVGYGGWHVGIEAVQHGSA